jgi:excisionase family DNA binding protein
LRRTAGRDGAGLPAGKRWQTETSEQYRALGDLMEPRFLLMADVADQLNVSTSQVYHMVRSGELPAIKIGGRGQWRIERSKLEEYIERKYAETAEWVRANPLVDREDADDEP